MSAEADAMAVGAVEAPTAMATKNYAPPIAVGAWLTNAFGLRWLRAFYEEVLWKKCDEVLSFFDRSSSIQELAGEGKASISDQISAYVRQTMAYEAWEAVCRKLHETLKGWIVLLMFFASIILPLKPIHGGGPRSALMLFTLIPLGAVAILVANSPRHIANSRLWLHLLIYFLTVFAGCTVILMGTPERFSTQARPSERLLIVLPVILLWASGAALGVLALSRKNRRSAIGLFLAILALASILEAFPLRTWPWWVDDGLRIGLWMVVLSNLLFGLAVATDALIRTFISKRKHAKHPVSSIVSSLLSTTLAVEDGTTLAAEDGSAIEEISNRLPESPAREADVRDADAPLRAWQTIDFGERSRRSWRDWPNDTSGISLGGFERPTSPTYGSMPGDADSPTRCASGSRMFSFRVATHETSCSVTW